MSKHTPGPWSMEEYALKVEIYAGERFIATVHSRDCESPEEMKANAQLIATAQELLEILEKIAMGDQDDSYCIPGQLILDAEKAIAKARWGV